jgi:thiamine-phosphate pyrophosphorylase
LSSAGRGRWRLDERRLYLCTSDRPDLVEFVEACVAGGVDIVQLREKHLADRHLIDRAAAAADVCRRLGVPFVLNDRPDLAAAVGADGVHVGQEDTPAGEARRLVGDGLLVGLSTHGVAELEAVDWPAIDYVSAGPVVPTPTKPGRPGTGVGYAASAVRRSPVPVWVTGGVEPEGVPALVAAGIRHFVAVRWLTGAADPRAAASALRGAIDDALAAHPPPAVPPSPPAPA